MPFSAWKMTCRSAGTKLATSVGRPMPRLTVIPSSSSCAIRIAISSRVSPCGRLVMARSTYFWRSSVVVVLFPTREWDTRSVVLAEPANLVALADDDAVDVDARRHDALRIELADLDQVVDLGDHDPRRGRHRHVEVAARAVVDEVAQPVAARGLDQRVVGVQRPLEQVGHAVDLARL